MIWTDMDWMQDKDIHGMEWYNGTIRYINTTSEMRMQMRATKCRLLTPLTLTSLEGLHLACNRIDTGGNKCVPMSITAHMKV